MIIPISTAYAVCESFGLESGMNHKYKEAPEFYGLLTIMIFLSSLLVLIPGLSMVKMMLVTQQLAGLLCPIILIFMVLLTNNREIMGDYVNNRLQNIVIWLTVIFIAMLSVILFLSPIIDRLLHIAG